MWPSRFDLSNLGVIAALTVLVFAVPAWLGANPGDAIVENLPIPVPGWGVSAAADCTGSIYYTGLPDAGSAPTKLHKMDKNGVLLSTVDLVRNTVNGPPLAIDEMTWDKSRMALWGIEHREAPLKVYLIDPVSGVATFQFVANQSAPTGIFRDGIALDSDDTLWISGDVSDSIEHYSASGTFLGQVTPHDTSGVVLGSISGVVAGHGDVLYIGRNLLGSPSLILEVRKSDGLIIRQLAVGGNRVEGLECDAMNFAPRSGLWSREFGTYPTAPSHMDVFELEYGACACAGGSTGDDDDDDDDTGGLPPFKCDRPVDGLTMIWGGMQVVRVKAWKGAPGTTLLAEVNPVTPGQVISVSGLVGAPNDVTWEIFLYNSSTKLGESQFTIACSDSDMDGAEDCGKYEGNGKSNHANLINTWLFDGMVDRDEVLDCTP
jgi:hypothetical protein